MAKLPQKKFKVGPAKLRWIFVNGDGSLNDLGAEDKYEYKATAILSMEEAKPYIEAIENFWGEYKGTKKIKPSSFGYKILEDEEGEPTGEVSFTFKTNAEFTDRRGNTKPAVIRIFRANGQEITKSFHEAEKKAANDSEGVIHGLMAIYETKAKKGVTLYLNGIQFTKFIEYEGSLDVDSIDEIEDDGFDSDGLSDDVAEDVKI